MSQERRVRLGELCDHYGIVLIEDDPYGALRFRGGHLDPLRSANPQTVTLGTVSKLLAPGLRVGWAAAPGWLIGPLVRLKQARDLHTSSLSQHLVLDVVGDGAFMASHLSRLPTTYRVRCDALAGALSEQFEDRAVFVQPDGGMFLWVTFPGVDTADWLPRALDHGVAFVPGSAFHRDGRGRAQARLSFATLSPEQLVEAVGRLVASL